jgi:hypothetical protein
MGIGDSIMVASCLAGLMLALPAILIFLNLAFLRISEDAIERLSYGGCLPFFAGLALLLFIGLPAAILLSIGSVAQAIGGLFALLLLMWGFVGLGAVARLIGIRITEMNEREQSPLIQTTAGAFVLSFAVAFPLLGWFVVLPISLVVGAGALNLVLLSRMFRLFQGDNQPSPNFQPPPPAYYPNE